MKVRRKVRFIVPVTTRAGQWSDAVVSAYSRNGAIREVQMRGESLAEMCGRRIRTAG